MLPHSLIYPHTLPLLPPSSCVHLTPSHLILSLLTHTHTLTLLPPYTLSDKLLIFFANSPNPRDERSGGGSTEPNSDTILSTVSLRNMETGNSIVISVYRDLDFLTVSPFFTALVGQPMVCKCTCGWLLCLYVPCVLDLKYFSRGSECPPKETLFTQDTIYWMTNICPPLGNLKLPDFKMYAVMYN